MIYLGSRAILLAEIDFSLNIAIWPNFSGVVKEDLAFVYHTSLIKDIFLISMLCFFPLLSKLAPTNLLTFLSWTHRMLPRGGEPAGCS